MTFLPATTFLEIPQRNKDGHSKLKGLSVAFTLQIRKRKWKSNLLADTLTHEPAHSQNREINRERREITRAMLKMKLLMGIYNLEGKRLKFKNKK